METRKATEKEIQALLDGSLSDQERKRVLELVEQDDSLLHDADPQGRVRAELERSDPAAGMFEEVDVSASVHDRLLLESPAHRARFGRFVVLTVAAAFILALGAVFFAPDPTSSGPVFTCPPIHDVTADLEFQTPSGEWSPVDDGASLQPGTLVRSNAHTSFSFGDGSSLSLRGDSVLKVGGEGFDYTLALMKGEMLADIRNKLFVIKTPPATLKVREGMFVLYADDPLVRPPTYTQACNAAGRSSQKVTILSVSQGLVETDNEKFMEGSRRDWPYEPNADTIAALKQFQD